MKHLSYILALWVLLLSTVPCFLEDKFLFQCANEQTEEPCEMCIRDSDYTKEDIDRIYRYKESLPENHQFIKENHKETLAQVFTAVSYTHLDVYKRQL